MIVDDQNAHRRSSRQRLGLFRARPGLLYAFD
jgi:hypothetical protein